MKLVDFERAKEQGSLWDSQSATGYGKLLMLASFCRQSQKMSRDCVSHGDNLALAFLLRQVGCSLSVDADSSHVIYCGFFASFEAASSRLGVA